MRGVPEMTLLCAADTARENILIVSYHSHSRFCDGKGEPEEFVRAALEKGFSVFGFSSHAPLPFETEWNMKTGDLPEYIRLTRELKERYAGRIELYTGLEADFFDGCTDWRTQPGIAYTLGAVHFLPHPQTGTAMPVDGNAKEFRETLETGFDGDIQAFGEAYYGKVREMLLSMPPNILAHLDVFRKNNSGERYFSEDDEWYREEIAKTLEVISLTDVIVEVNTGGMSRGYLKDPYPSWRILEEILASDIPIQLNSDVHQPDAVDFGYESVRAQLLKMGFTKQRVLYGGIWQDVSF